MESLQPVLFNDLIRFRSQGGIAHYVKGLLSGFSDSPTCLSSLWWVKPLVWTSRHKPITSSAQKAKPHDWLRYYLDSGLGFTDFRLFHEPDFIVSQFTLPSFVTLHDLSVLVHPEFHPEHRVTKYKAMFEKSIQHTQHIFSVSEFSKREAIRLLNFSPNQITVVPNGPSPSAGNTTRTELGSTLKKYDLSSDYLVFVGTVEPRKNLRLLIEAFTALPSASTSKNRLLIVGNQGWNCEEEMRLLEKNRDLIHWVKGASDLEVASLLQGAKALVLPSFYEGFGIPILDAIVSKVPVICSDIPPFREVAEGWATFLSPHEPAPWTHAMNDILEKNRGWMEAPPSWPSQIHKFNWKQSAQKIAQAYRTYFS